MSRPGGGTDRLGPGAPRFRLRLGFLVIALVLSVYGARLVQLQAVDPGAYAQRAAQEGTVDVVLPAERGRILDRNGDALAESSAGLMIIADPQLVNVDGEDRPVDRAPELAKLLATRLHLDYFTLLQRLRATDTQFQYLARQVPADLATRVVAQAKARGFDGLSTERDPIRVYPSKDVAANLVGFLGLPDQDGVARPLAGFEAMFDSVLAGRDGSATYSVDSRANGNRIPLGQSTVVPARNGADLTTTIDRDLQWYVQRVLRTTVEQARGDSGVAVVLDSRTGQVLSLADYPSYDANDPAASPKADRGARSLRDVYEPGSVEKVLTLSSLIDAGKVTDRTRLTVPGSLARQDRVIHDWFPHDTLRLTLAGVLAKSSNIGTVLAADRFDAGQLRGYLERFGLGRATGVGVQGEAPGILPSGAQWTPQVQDRIAFGQSVSVNAVQMAAAVNTIANRGVRVDPSLVLGHATTADGRTVGSDDATTRRVVSAGAARQTTLMMERVVDPDAGVAPGARVPGYRVAGKTGTAQRANPDCGCYDGTFTVSFAGFAPADDPRFTVYVVVQNPRNGGGGGSVAGPAFSEIMSYALRRYAVPPTGTAPSSLPVTW
ncbi:penicillin-binding protein 2 [Nocardioides sp. TRM66260-LWL]|uniref:peptidoglycan D,D-transpeptidase FtsI family protein n=1 Tax=Nocardioides sp. TRM66260-LWL TaxID=2874478 RepID=UPI001CC569EA|nr:penicillin-binding protein 2 [Nocardioides sp. TRM66260-LWL]MBZ5733343.1 penicillin-binding protein 2 [Nocardioides sp. TRM66260-LWL]